MYCRATALALITVKFPTSPVSVVWAATVGVANSSTKNVRAIVIEMITLVELTNSRHPEREKIASLIRDSVKR